MSNASDFIIENGVVKGYTGSGGRVVIPEGVTGIGDHAFYHGYGKEPTITEVFFPERLVSIGEKAFWHCWTLKSIVIPKSVKTIGEEAFWYVNFQELVLLGKPKIGKQAFASNHDVAPRIQAPDDFAVIPYMNDWADCEDHDIIATVRSAIRAADIKREADRKWIVRKLMSRMKSAVPAFFQDITAEELDFLAKYQAVTAKNADALLELVADRPDLKAQLLGIIHANVTLDQRMEKEEHEADLNVNRIIRRSKLLEDTLKEFGEKKPAQIKKEWAAESGEGGLTVTKYKGEATSFVIPAFIGGKPVICLAEDAFRASCSLESGKKSAYNKKMYKTKAVIVQEGITRIGARAFAGCVFMTDICLPSSVTEIGEDAFKDCHKLTIHAPEGSFAETYAKENSIPFAAE